MLLVTILLFASLITVCLSCFTGWINGWGDLWIVIVTFIVSTIIGFILLAIYLFLSSWILSIKNKHRTKPSKYAQRLIKAVCELFLQVSRVKVLVRGLEKIPTDKPFVLISNHQSNYDSVETLWTMRYFPLIFIMKDSLMKVPVLGVHATAAGFLGLDRNNARNGIKTIQEAIREIEEYKFSVAICPEGTRSKGYEMKEFHHGSFKIAVKSHSPIVVCAIQNSCQIHKRTPFRSTYIYYDVVDVLKYEDYKDKNTQEISDEVYQMIKNKLEELPKYE